MDKYYTPSIEEFHIGFEYEEKYDSKNWDKREFIYSEHIDSYGEDCLDDFIIEGIVRVKYLDKEDIESLGFECIKDNVFRLDKDLLEVFDYTDGTIRIWWNDEDDSFDDYIHQPVFWGIIKNLSELKVLLKQLGIDGE